MSATPPLSGRSSSWWDHRVDESPRPELGFWISQDFAAASALVTGGAGFPDDLTTLRGKQSLSPMDRHGQVPTPGAPQNIMALPE